MPRRNRPRRRNVGRAEEPPGVEHALDGGGRSERRHGARWRVQPIAAPRALKSYVCPGCGGTIPPRVAHVVAWREDGVLGDAADLAARRHWHEHCWRIG